MQAPVSARNISHCVSHGSPWVPRNAVAASPVASAVHHSIKFVEGAKGEANCDRQEGKPFAGFSGVPPDQDFTGENGGNKALCEMSDPVVMVAGNANVSRNQLKRGTSAYV